MVDFNIYNSSQPGCYQYDVWVSRLDSGCTYLKIYEITMDYPLSPEGIKENTQVQVCNLSDTLKYFSSQKEFKIYEGDFGKPYAARFELWFAPVNKETEQLLLQKNYKVEGWQH